MAYTVESNPTRDQVWGRIFLFGPTGSGKSRGALELANRMFGGTLPIGLVNTEKGRGKLYADRYPIANYIDMSEVRDFAPDAYTLALNTIEAKQGGGVYILDSVSHEWMGRNGILQQADRFGDWKVVRPKHNDWVERLMDVNGHLIVTVRAKMKYEVEEEEKPGGGKRQVIRALGVGPIQSDDLQYEFTLVGNFEQSTHEVRWSGHVDPLVDTVSNFSDEESATETASVLTKWLSEGNPPPPPPEAADEKAVAELVKSLHAEGFADALIEERFAVAKAQNRGVLGPEYVGEQLTKSKERLAKKPKPEAAEETRQETLA
jgi:hypothetical protein